MAWNVDKGLIVSRLMRFDHTDALVSDQRQHESISLAPESQWRIVGQGPVVDRQGTKVSVALEG